MKPNRFDTVLNYAVDRANKVKSFIQEEYGNTKPFNTELIEGIDKLYIYDKLQLPENQDIKMQIITKHGYEAYVKFQEDALKSRKARGL